MSSTQALGGQGQAKSPASQWERRLRREEGVPAGTGIPPVGQPPPGVDNWTARSWLHWCQLECEQESFQMPPGHKLSGLQIINLLNSTAEISALGAGGCWKSPSSERSISRSKVPSLPASHYFLLTSNSKSSKPALQIMSNLSTRGSSDSLHKDFHSRGLGNQNPIHKTNYLDTYKWTARLVKESLVFWLAHCDKMNDTNLNISRRCGAAIKIDISMNGTELRV